MLCRAFVRCPACVAGHIRPALDALLCALKLMLSTTKCVALKKVLARAKMRGGLRGYIVVICGVVFHRQMTTGKTGERSGFEG